MSKVFGFRLPADLRTYLEAQSQKRRMSMGSYIVALIKRDRERREALKNDQKLIRKE